MSENGRDIRGYRYVVKSDHRDQTPIKSQWTVDTPTEFEVFERTVDQDWISDGHGWGLHISEGITAYLGKPARDGGSRGDLFVAYFVFESVCHGYPSDPQRSSREIPPQRVRQEWLAEGLLRPATIRKLGRGQACRL